MKKKILSLAMACMLLAQAPAGVMAQETGDKTPKENQEVTAPVEIKEIPEVKSEQIVKEVIELGGKINLEDNIKDLPEGTTVRDITNPAIDTNKAGETKGQVEVTFADGSARIVDVPVVINLPAIDKTLAGKYLEKIQFVNGVKEGKATLELPKAPAGYAVDVNILLKDTSIIEVKGVTEGKNVELDYSKIPYTVKAKLIRLADKQEAEEAKKDVNCPEIHAPKLNYAYIYDGGLVVNVSAEMGIKDIFWAYEGDRIFNKLPLDAGYGRKYTYRPETNKNKDEYDFSELFGVKEEKLDKYTRLNSSDYRINLREIPANVNIVAVDKLGNKTPITIKVEKDNTILTKGVPEDVQKAIKSAMNFTYNGEKGKYEDLIVIEKDTTVDMFETFEKYIVKQLDRFNTRDLNWRFVGNDKENIPYTGVYKFTKVGNFEIVVQDETSGREAKMTVIVNEGRNNLRSYKVTNKAVEVKGDKFTGLEALDAVKYNNKEKVNALALVVRVDGKYYKLDEEIAFGDKSEVKATIIDLKENKTYDVTFTKKPVVTANELTDIKGHWAEAMIKKLVDRGVIAGYENKTFKPDNHITIRETLAILGRYAKQNEKNIKPLVVDYKALEAKDTNGKIPWGYEEVTFAINRLDKNIFAGQNIDTDAITREQVAYVMDNLFKINDNGKAVELTDLDKAQYEASVKNLTANGVIKGYPDKTFKPADKITRAELSSLLFNMPAEFK